MSDKTKSRHASAFSAGGVVYRVVSALDGSSELVVEVALVGRLKKDIWALPKGTPKVGEKPEETALREVREETGLYTRIVAELGRIQYTFTRKGVRYHKEVLHFLMEATGGDTSEHDAEYDVVEWTPTSLALERLAYENEAAIVRRAEALLRERVPGAAG